MGENPPQGEFCLFPGFLLLALALAGAVLAVARRDAAARTGLLWAAIGFVGSFGTRTPFHTLLYYAFPLFRAIRAPVRWAMVADLGFALLAGAAAAALAERLAPKSRGARALPARPCAASSSSRTASPPCTSTAASLIPTRSRVRSHRRR